MASCSYCLNEAESFEVTGKKRMESGDFKDYRLCHACNSKLTNLNPTIDTKKRKDMWELIWKNAEAS